jgi:hypothetical protein
MVDWNRVERLRAKGRDWSSIAADPKVGFAPPEGAGDAGRSLKTLYLTHRSQRGHGSHGAGTAGSADGPAAPRRTSLSRGLTLVGLGVVPLAGVWSLLGWLRPDSAGALVPVIPWLLGGLAAGAGMLAAGLALRGAELRGLWVKPVAIGLVLGLVGVGGSVLFAAAPATISTGVPVSYGGGWSSAPNSVWSEGGHPVILFLGSEAGPPCAAMSWALRMALERFGSFAAPGYGYSMRNDPSGSSVPEVDLAGSSLTSSYLTWDPKQGADNTTISIPPLDATENTYVSAYDSGTALPFLVIGGEYFHVGALVNPMSLMVNGVNGDPYSIAAVNQQIQSQSGPAYSAIVAEAYLLEAYFVKIDQKAGLTPPSAVASDPNVSGLLPGIP